MKAVRYSKYGAPEVLKLTEVKKPAPKANEILVKVHTTSVTSGDVRLRASDFPPLFWLPARLIFGLFKPKKQILGHEWAGVIEQTGKEVTQFNIGDEVFGTTSMLKTGAYAEYLCVPETWSQGAVIHRSKNLSFEESAVLPIAGMTALFLLEKAKIEKGQHILVNGASGSVGSYTVQIAKHLGAVVTGVCSTGNIEMVRSLGATNVIDYKKEDFTQSKKHFDIIFDAVGKISKSKTKLILSTNGHFISTKMLTKESPELLEKVKKLAEQKAIIPYIDRQFKLADIVTAHNYVDTGRKRGNVSIKVINEE